MILALLFCPCWHYHVGIYSIFFIVFISLSFQGPGSWQTLGPPGRPPDPMCHR